MIGNNHALIQNLIYKMICGKCQRNIKIWEGIFIYTGLYMLELDWNLTYTHVHNSLVQKSSFFERLVLEIIWDMKSQRLH